MSASCSAPAYKSYRELLVQRRGPLLVVQFNRPAVRNALRRRTIYELIRALDAANEDAQVSVVVLAGNAESFTAGNDLSDVLALQRAGGPALAQHFRGGNYVLRTLVKKLALCRKLLVALVRGLCIGIGVTMCALCDVVYATDTAQFWTPFSRLGLCVEAGGSWALPYILGRSKAAELLLFGVRMDAQTALRHSFVAAVVPEEQLEAAFWAPMAEYGRLPLESLLASKRLLQLQWRPQLLAALEEECTELERLRRGSVYMAQLAAFAKRSKL